MAKNENRKSVYFSKANQDLKEYIEDNDIDFTSYVLDLIRRDYEGQLDVIEQQQRSNRKVLKSLESVQDELAELKEIVEQLKNAPTPTYMMPSYGAMPSGMMPGTMWSQPMTEPVPTPTPQGVITKETPMEDKTEEETPSVKKAINLTTEAKQKALKRAQKGKNPF